MVMAYLTPAERWRVFSLVSVAFGRGAAALKRSAKFGPNQLVLADGSLALDRVEAASIRFPALEDVTVNLNSDLRDSNGFTDARRAPILAKLCTFTFVTKLVLMQAVGIPNSTRKFLLYRSYLLIRYHSVSFLSVLIPASANALPLASHLRRRQGARAPPCGR